MSVCFGRFFDFHIFLKSFFESFKMGRKSLYEGTEYENCYRDILAKKPQACPKCQTMLETQKQFKGHLQRIHPNDVKHTL